MRRWIIYGMGLAVLWGMLWMPDTARALEYQLFAEVFSGLFMERNYPDLDTATFDVDDTYLITGLYPEAHVDFSDQFSGHALAELEWTHVRDADDENDLNLDMADLYLKWAASKLSLYAGLQPFTGGRGMIYDTDESGVSVSWDARDDFSITGDAFRMFDHSPMAKLTLGYEPGFLESVDVFGVWYHDRDDRVADLYGTFETDADISGSSGDLFWVGGQAEFFVGDLFVSCLGVQEFGSVKIRDDSGAVALDASVSAYLFDLEVNYNFTEKFSAAAFVFGASGDGSPDTGDWHAFMSPMPFNRRTAVFFNGGFERYDIEEKMVLGGVTWDGVVAPGVKMEYQPHPKIVAEMTVAAMYPEGDFLDGDMWYGWETDVRLSWRFYQTHWLFLEADRFGHGAYFENSRGFRPDPAIRLVAGVQFLF